MKHLLTCPACQRPHAVGPTQAGQQITCDCGAIVSVPSLRELRELRELPAADSRPVLVRQAWNPARGMAAALSILVTLAGLLIAGYGLLVWLQLDTSTPPQADLAAGMAEIDRLSTTETLRLWQEYSTTGLGPYWPPQQYFALEMARFYERFMLVGGVLFVLGAAGTSVALLTRKSAAK